MRPDRRASAASGGQGEGAAEGAAAEGGGAAALRAAALGAPDAAAEEEAERKPDFEAGAVLSLLPFKGADGAKGVRLSFEKEGIFWKVRAVGDDEGAGAAGPSTHG